MSDENQLKALVEKAYRAVEGLNADDAYKIEGFKIVLKVLVGGEAAPIVNAGAAGQKGPETDPEPNKGTWQDKIAAKLEMSAEEIGTIYHLEEDELRVIIDHKKMPGKNMSKCTQHLAALLAAGRQALNLDENGRTSHSLIKDVCVEYGCYNARNFTTYVKKLGNKFIYKDKALQLTRPAFGATKDIAKKYVEERE